MAILGDAEPPDLESWFEACNGGRPAAAVRPESRSENGKPRLSADGGAGSESRPENGKPRLSPDGAAGSESRSETGKPEPAGDRCACGGIQPKFRRGVADIQVKLSTLAELDNDPALIPGWGSVIADIARQVAHDRRTNPAWKWSVTDDDGQLLLHGHTRRRPDAAEDAFVRARDRSCRAPGCRRRAARCELDHRIEWARGGPSHRGNLDARCNHHHRFRGQPGHTINRTDHGIRWTTPNGRSYDIGPDKDISLTSHDDTRPNANRETPMWIVADSRRSCASHVPDDPHADLPTGAVSDVAAKLKRSLSGPGRTSGTRQMSADVAGRNLLALAKLASLVANSVHG